MNRLTYFIITVVLISATELAAQQVILSIPTEKATFEDIFTDIESQSNVWFAYITEEFDSHTLTVVPQGKKPLQDLLDELFKHTHYTYSIDGKHIFITRKDEPRPARQTYVLPPNRLRSSINPDATAPLSEDERRILIRPGVDSTYNVISHTIADSILRVNLRIDSNHTNPVNHRSPAWALKTNLLYGGATLTPNLAVEIGLGRRTSLELSASYHPWKRENNDPDNKKFVHSIYRPEFRWWLCERFNGHFFGLHAFYANYNINGYKVPLLFKKEYRHEGWALGGGATYGYHWSWSKHWGMEFNLGLGLAYLDYKRYDCVRCSQQGEAKTKTYFGPTRLGISLVYILK